MKYSEERTQLVNIIDELRRWDLLDCGGGAVSARLSSGDILMSTTGSAFRRWKVGPEDFVVLTSDGSIVEQTGGLGASGTPIHLAIYELFDRCGAIIHSHTAYSRAFAALGRSVPNCLNTLDTLGAVPCLAANDAEVKAAYRARPIPFDMPEGVVQRPDVAAVNVLHLIPELKQKMLARAGELNHHGLAFTLYRHGVFAFARNLDEAFDNLNRVESGARTAIHLATLMGGLDRVSTNPLYPDHGRITE